MTNLRRLLTAVTLGATLAPATAAGQAVVVERTRGWIGVSVELRASVDEFGRTRSVAVVDDVQTDSPAARAGLRRGDVLVSINGQPYELGFPRIAQAIRPGDSVSMVLARDGQERTVRVVASERPVVAAEPPRWAMRLEVDSMAESMFRAMDSLRVQLLTGEDGVTVMRLRGPEGATILRRAGEREREAGEFRFRSVSPFGARDDRGVQIHVVDEVRPPFGFFLFEGERQDSLEAEMARLNDEIRQVRVAERRRLSELGTSSGSDARGRVDPQLVQLRQRAQTLANRSVELRRAMEQAAQEAARSSNSLWSLAGPSEGTSPTSAAEPFRPLAPYVLGQNRAAGAEVVDLRPELADYFEVSGGVLVVDVPAGTPAARAGIQPGDVIVRVGDTQVASIQDLRAGMAQSGARTPISLVRKGRPIEVLLQR